MSNSLKQAVIYARFSPRRNASECVSCDTQIEYCEKYCDFKKLEVVGIFRDDGLTGTNVNRPGLREALDMTRRCKGTLVFYSLSRLARSVRDALEIGDGLKKAGANLCSVTESINSVGAFGKLFFVLLAGMAEWERDVISERTSDAMRCHQRNGRRMSDRLPFGWQADDDDASRMVPNEVELDVIKQVVSLKKQGFSLRATCAQLYEWDYVPRPVKKKFKGQPVECKGKWHYSTIRAILKRAEQETS